MVVGMSVQMIYLIVCNQSIGVEIQINICDSSHICDSKCSTLIFLSVIFDYVILGLDAGITNYILGEVVVVIITLFFNTLVLFSIQVCDGVLVGVCVQI